eukprot:m.49882 g.49882  ORF g.49882 m.49882 type:complete len:60 (+) comp10635_c0_seq2:1930-2109(+)
MLHTICAAHRQQPQNLRLNHILNNVNLLGFILSIIPMVKVFRSVQEDLEGCEKRGGGEK